MFGKVHITPLPLFDGEDNNYLNKSLIVLNLFIEILVQA